MNLAYVAGLFDGEGCVQFGRARKCVYPKVIITNTDYQVLVDLREQFGGDIQPLSKRQVNWKQGYYWRLSWSKCVDFLSAVEPWLRIKSHQASVIFAWNAIRQGRGRKPDEEAIKLLQDQLKWLNTKGPTRVSTSPVEEVINAIETG